MQKCLHQFGLFRKVTHYYLRRGWIVKLKFIAEKPTSEQEIKFDKAGNMQIRKHFETSLFWITNKVADFCNSNITGHKHMLFRNLND